MKGFTGRDVLLLSSHGLLPKDIAEGWRKKNGRPLVNDAVDADQLGSLARAVGFWTVTLGLGCVLLGRLSQNLTAVPDLSGPGLIILAAGTAALGLAYIFEWGFQRGAGRSLMYLLSYYGLTVRQLALLSKEERISLAVTRLQTQADALKAAEDLCRLTPDDEQRIRVAAIQRSALKAMFNVYASFDLADSEKGWKPFLNPDVSQASEKPTEVEAGAAQTASA